MPSTSSRLPVSPGTVHADCYCLNAQRAARRLARLYDDALRPFGLTHGQFSLLMLVEGLQPVSVGRIASELVMDRTTVTAVIKPLTRRGLLQTTASPDDRRMQQLSLTREGRALLVESSGAWKEVQALVQRNRPGASLRGELRRLAGTASPVRK